MKKEQPKKRKPKLCPKCGINKAGDKDICPYDEEINDKITYCYCCDECRQQCADDI